MGVPVLRATVGGWSPGPLKSLVTRLSLLANCYLGNKFHASQYRAAGVHLRMVFTVTPLFYARPQTV